MKKTKSFTLIVDEPLRVQQFVPKANGLKIMQISEVCLYVFPKKSLEIFLLNRVLEAAWPGRNLEHFALREEFDADRNFLQMVLNLKIVVCVGQIISPLY